MQRLKFHVENTPLAVVELNREFQIINGSHRAERVFGWKAEEVLGKRIDELRRVHPEDAERAAALSADRLSSRRTSNIHTNRNFRKDGSIITCEWYNSAWLDAKGHLISVLSLVMDTTERIRVEEALIRSQKLESIGVLAGGIAHDFNNILTTIIGNISMARGQTQAEDDRFDLLNEAGMASARAQSLTRQLLTFAKGGAPAKEIASIKNVLKESSWFVLRGSKSTCEFSIAEGLWSAEVDVGQISQVINNMVINADQAMPEGGNIRIAAENVTLKNGHALPLSPGRYVKVSVADQGTGIAGRHLLSVFDPYFTTQQEGSGLGLATAYSTIKRHGGHITVESQLDKGTVLTIYLPASEKTAPEKKDEAPISGQGRILVMDDEASIRKMLGLMLGRLGYQPEFAADGAESVQRFENAKNAEKPYDAAILDLTIPGKMGGKDAPRAI